MGCLLLLLVLVRRGGHAALPYRLLGSISEEHSQFIGQCEHAKKKIHCDFPCFVASFISLFILVGLGELELELIQTQMTQKPMLRAEVYARALRASQNRKEDSV